MSKGAGVGVAVDDPIPIELRANDVVRHVINVDSCFRERATGATSAEFIYPLLTPVRNVLRVRVLSVEYPIGVPIFSAGEGNVGLRILFRDASGVLMAVPIVIPDGSYSPTEMVDVLATEIADTVKRGVLPFPITVCYDCPTRRFMFCACVATGGQRFGIDTMTGTIDRECDYGLGYYLGFDRGVHAARCDCGNWCVQGTHCADLTGDKYVFLRVNDYRGIRHTVNTMATDGPVNRRGYNEVVATTKILLGGGCDSECRVIENEVVFPAPIDITRLFVQVLDRYGEVVDLCGRPLSFSLEVLEVRNSSMYNMVRDGLAVSYR